MKVFWLTVQEDDLAVSSDWIGLVDQVTIETGGSMFLCMAEKRLLDTSYTIRKDTLRGLTGT